MWSDGFASGESRGVWSFGVSCDSWDDSSNLNIFSSRTVMGEISGVVSEIPDFFSGLSLRSVFGRHCFVLIFDDLFFELLDAECRIASSANNNDGFFNTS